MSLLGVLDRPNCLRVSHVGSRSLLAFLCPALQSCPLSRRQQGPRCALHQRRSSGRPAHPKPATLSPRLIHNAFIAALVRAGSCQQHVNQFSAWSIPPHSSTRHNTAGRKRAVGGYEARRGYRTKETFLTAAEAAEISREEYKGLLDYYGGWKAGPQNKRPKPNPPPPPEEPEQSKQLMKSHKPLPPRDEFEQHAIQELRRLLEDPRSTHSAVFATYKSISFPRVSYLSLRTIRKLLRFMTVVEKKDETTQIRYLSIMDDMKAAGIPMNTAEWSTAIYFAGRCLERVTSAEVQSALYIWRQMEQEAGVMATNVTMNILFDIAIKAHKFALAERIVKEMSERKHYFDRFFRVSQIYYLGIKGDGEGIRRVYKRLVDDGEIVDTVVLNCVLLSLLRSSEPTAAELLFARMKRMHVEKSREAASTIPSPDPDLGKFSSASEQPFSSSNPESDSRLSPHLPPNHWLARRALGRLLSRVTRNRHRTPALARRYEHLRVVSPIAPDLITFTTLITYHALRSGNLYRVVELLEEQQVDWGIPLALRSWEAVFRGFRAHGGVRYSMWTPSILEAVWKALEEWLQKGGEAAPPPAHAKYRPPPPPPPPPKPSDWGWSGVDADGEVRPLPTRAPTSAQQPIIDGDPDPLPSMLALDTLDPDPTPQAPHADPAIDPATHPLPPPPPPPPPPRRSSYFSPSARVAAPVPPPPPPLPPPPPPPAPARLGLATTKTVLLAFARVAGPERAVAVWGGIEERWWCGDEEEREEVVRLLGDVLQQGGGVGGGGG